MAKKKSARVGKKAKRVMREYGRGELHSGGSGKKVTDPKQAFAIAMSEQRESEKRKRKSQRSSKRSSGRSSRR